jgi:hypothetical protein
MMARTFLDVVGDPPPIPVAALDAALEHACPIVVKACLGLPSRASMSALRNGMLAELPEALDVSLRRCIQRTLGKRARADLVRGVPARIALRTTALFEFDDHEMPDVQWRLQASVSMEQPGGVISLASDKRQMLLGDGRAWLANWSLQVSDALSRHAATFARGQREIHLAPEPLAFRTSPRAFEGGRANGAGLWPRGIGTAPMPRIRAAG